jgi:hypothetical protein
MFLQKTFRAYTYIIFLNDSLEMSVISNLSYRKIIISVTISCGIPDPLS